MCTALEKLKQQGIEEGKKEGIEQGKKEGIEEGKLTVIKNLLANGLSMEEIKKFAGVTEKEIRKANNNR